MHMHKILPASQFCGADEASFASKGRSPMSAAVPSGADAACGRGACFEPYPQPSAVTLTLNSTLHHASCKSDTELTSHKGL